VAAASLRNAISAYDCTPVDDRFFRRANLRRLRKLCILWISPSLYHSIERNAMRQVAVCNDQRVRNVGVGRGSSIACCRRELLSKYAKLFLELIVGEVRI